MLAPGKRDAVILLAIFAAVFAGLFWTWAGNVVERQRVEATVFAINGIPQRPMSSSTDSGYSYILQPDGTIQFLEVNVAPGMTETSLLPQAVVASAMASGGQEGCADAGAASGTSVPAR